MMLLFHHPHQLIRKPCLFYLYTHSDFHCLDYSRDSVPASRYSSTVQFLYYLSEFFLSALKRPGSSLVSYIYLPWIMSFTDMATTSQSLGATKSGSLGRIYTVFCLFVYFNFERLQHAKSQFPDQGSNLCPLRWDHRILTPGPPGKSYMLCFKY